MGRSSRLRVALSDPLIQYVSLREARLQTVPRSPDQFSSGRLTRLNRIGAPTYDRELLRPGVVHLGVGGFHRAHQAVYLDDLARHSISHDWGITGVNLRRAVIRDALACQDG